MSAELEWLNKGIDAARSGDVGTARDLLSRVVNDDPNNETAWLWLASVVESDEELRICLENVLTLNPDNENARARLALLDQTAPAVPAPKPEPLPQEITTPSTLAPSPTEFDIEEIVGCPYCGQDADSKDTLCPHCRKPLVIERPKDSPAPSRIWILTASWMLLAIIYIAIDWIIFSALLALISGGEQGGIVAEYTTGVITAYLVNPASNPDITPQTMTLILQILLAAEGIAIAWCLAIAFMLPSRRSGAGLIASLVILVNAILMIFEFIIGIHVSLLKLIPTVVVGIFLFTGTGDFVWETVRYSLSLDRGLVTALDYYNRGRRHREKGMTANAILHWERAVAIEPGRVAFLIPLANALYRAGRYQEASEHVRAALGQMPFDSPESENLRQFLKTIQTRLPTDTQ